MTINQTRFPLPAAPEGAPVATTVAIVGGGFSGAAVAYHLAGNPALAGVGIVVFEPRAEIGRGLAYDTADAAHRINVPAARMSLLPDDPDHFARWLAQTDALADDPAATRPDGALYPRRGVFGAYVHDNLRPHLDSGAVRHIRSAVSDVRRVPGGWEIADESGRTISAAILVIATTHPPPAAPRALVEALGHHPRFVADPTRPGALDAVRPDDRVLIVGNGLTAADVVASLAHAGHQGSILSVSRRGLRSRGHAPVAQDPLGEFRTPPAGTALNLLKRIRATIADAAESGLTWHAVIDQVRGQAGDLWQDLSVTERRRIVRHLRIFWDVHRFRVAPQVEEALDSAIRDGRLAIVPGSIRNARASGERIHVTVQPKGHHETVTHTVDAVVVTTGPAHGRILASQPWLQRLGDAGHLHLDPTGLGIDCNLRSEALDADLRPDPSLLISGPLARGRFGELMGLPQVSAHAALVAGRVAAVLNQTSKDAEIPLEPVYPGKAF